MKKLSPGTRSFSLRANWGKLIVNLSDSDHGWSSTIIRVSSPWVAMEAKACGGVPMTWTTSPITQGVKLTTDEFMEWANRLLNIDYDSYNWSWLLDPHKPVVPPDVPKDKSAVDDVA